MTIRETDRQTAYPDSVIVTKISDDGKTKIEYVYNNDKAPRTEDDKDLFEAQKELDREFPGSRMELSKNFTFNEILKEKTIKERLPFIIIKFILCFSFFFFCNKIFSIYKMNIVDVIFMIIGSLCFAIVPFNKLRNSFREISEENKDRRNRDRYSRHNHFI